MLDLLLPQRCVACGAAGAQVCARCVDALPRLGEPCCERCGNPAAWPVARCVECAARRLSFASARAAVAYDDRVRAVVAAWKEHGLRRLAALVADVVAEVIVAPPGTAITFVPAARDRRLHRGHHPAERLACELAERWQLPLRRLLRRNGPATRQRGASLAERRSNVRRAFAPAGASPRRVILVDDVYTSGATANAASSALRKAGAREVHVVTFARALRLR